MAISPNIDDREYQKFTEDSNGETAVRTLTEIVGAIEASFAPSGLRIGGKITIMSINASTWTKIPAIPLPDRNAISIQNYSGSEIKINYTDSVGGYVGVAIPDKGERFYDITETIELYAKSESGVVSITVEEIA